VLLLIPLLITGLRRNNDLMRALPRISQKMLTQTLRSVDERRIVARDDFGQIPPRVEYELTPLGRSLARAIASLDSAWPCTITSRSAGVLRDPVIRALLVRLDLLRSRRDPWGPAPRNRRSR
jgi:DNA-binding HxlR family transcriptional regulator